LATIRSATARNDAEWRCSDLKQNPLTSRTLKGPLFDTSARGNPRIDDRARKIRDFPTILKGRGGGRAFGWRIFPLERGNHWVPQSPLAEQSGGRRQEEIALQRVDEGSNGRQGSSALKRRPNHGAELRFVAGLNGRRAYEKAILVVHV
jgi:hypothetical protein